jgi:hypothetical protein
MLSPFLDTELTTLYKDVDAVKPVGLTILFLTLTGLGLQCRFAQGPSFWQSLKMMKMMSR